MEQASLMMERAYEELRSARPLGAAHYDRAVKVLPRGTTRARFWEPMPLYVERAKGAHLWDLDGNEYVDCNVGQGALILGSAHPAVMSALADQAARGVHYGPTTDKAIELAELICGALPGAERVTFTNSGTEATLGALRIARAATGRFKVAKFEGGWHGANEYVLHSFAAVSGEPGRAEARADSAGSATVADANVVVLPFNDPRAFDRIRQEAAGLSCVIVEPVQGGAGCLPASAGFLTELRKVCDETGVLLVLDEVVTGFRLGPTSAAGRYQVTADLTTLGKAIGGGQPVGAICGRADLMELLVAPRAKLGPAKAVGAGGTFSGNPMTMVAGIAQLSELLDHPEYYARLDRLGERVRCEVEAVIAKREIAACVTGVGSMFRLHFADRAPRSVRDLGAGKPIATAVLRVYLELEGVIRGMGFVTTAHSDADVDRVVAAYDAALERLESEGLLDGGSRR